MRPRRRIRPHHRRDWRRLWLRCRCGYRWRCPDSVELVPRPYEPVVPPLDRATYRAVVRTSAPSIVGPDALPPPARRRATNQCTTGHLAERPGRSTPAQGDRARHVKRVQG